MDPERSLLVLNLVFYYRVLLYFIYYSSTIIVVFLKKIDLQLVFISVHLLVTINSSYSSTRVLPLVRTVPVGTAIPIIGTCTSYVQLE